MKKLLAALALVAFIAAPALAQKPDPKKDDPKKPADTKAPSIGKSSITIKPDAKGKFRLLIKDSDGKGFLMTAGGGFETEKEAREALDELKTILGAVKPTVEKADPADDKEKPKEK